MFKPFHKNNAHLTCRYLSKVTALLGVEIEVRIPDSVKDLNSVVYICNHQNTWDMFTLARAVRPNTVSVGKQSLKWIPFFGQMYWLTGNILIDRKNSSKAKSTIAHTASRINSDGLSVWLFPEGTRSNGKGILPFKTGAFRTAQQANVPVVPICASSTNNIKLNRWNNGKVIIEFLEPININNETNDTIKSVTQAAQQMISEKFNDLNREVNAAIEKESK
ncbi:1-acylglycerol-3-phosphate O-acyltransferase [Pseudocolwellia sp. HL-MZ19]|uniref:1-acylglycerol-3-phosphate O-acyltransferase n=1 Tax=Pseudocolwellia sp. HL-MZ19 TaxID=3400846 RepID=UPI003CE7D14F